MVFKILNKAKDDAYTVYTSGDTYAETEIGALDVTNFYSGVYKNEIVINWSDFGPTKASLIYFAIMFNMRTCFKFCFKVFQRRRYQITTNIGISIKHQVEISWNNLIKKRRNARWNDVTLARGVFVPWSCRFAKNRLGKYWLFTTCTNPIIHLFNPPKICIGVVFDFP